MPNICIWYQITCSECKALNWLYGGDPEDMTAPEIDGLKCYKCGFSEIFDHDITSYNHGDYNVDDVCDLGLESPK